MELQSCLRLDILAELTPGLTSVFMICPGIIFYVYDDFQDHSIAVLKKVLKQVEIIKSSRSGTPNFESHEVEANDLQAALAQYIEVRGTAKVLKLLDMVLFLISNSLVSVA